MSFVRGLVSNRSATDPSAADPRLRGRTYAIPFDRVWTAALQLAAGGLPRWSLLSADDHEGVVRARVTTAVLRRVDEVRIRVGLDENGQTRVDLVAASLHRRRDLGSNARHIHRFLTALDERLEASPAQILDSSRAPQFTT